jgi:hypothetical protein
MLADDAGMASVTSPQGPVPRGHLQLVLPDGQGGIILAQALDDPAPAHAAFDHLERDRRRLFDRPLPRG